MDRYVTAGGCVLRFWSAGDGPRTVLLLHGLGSSVEEWLLALPPLSERFRVYALDLPGHGLSDKPDVRYTPGFYADAVRDFLRSQGADTVSLVGRSLGGAVCAELAATHPELCERLVLLAPPGLGRELALSLRLLTVPLLGEYLTRRPRRSAGTPGSRPAWKGRLPADVADALTRMREQTRTLPAARRALLRTLRESAGIRGIRPAVLRRAREHLRRIRAPTLLLWGDRDPVVPIAHGERALGELPDARLKVVADCGHQAPLEQPEAVDRLLAGFLST